MTDDALHELGKKKLRAREALGGVEAHIASGMRNGARDMAERWEMLYAAEEAVVTADRAFRDAVQERQTLRRMRKGGLQCLR